MSTKSWPEKMKGRERLQDSGVDSRIILEYILGK
jgi:hypothetical protein